MKDNSCKQSGFLNEHYSFQLPLQKSCIHTLFSSNFAISFKPLNSLFCCKLPRFAVGWVEERMLLANYFFMSETLISSLSALQNSIHLNRDTTRSQDSQDVKECFTNSVRHETQQNPQINASIGSEIFHIHHCHHFKKAASVPCSLLILLSLSNQSIICLAVNSSKGT
jgi:hypothetical protein